MGEAQPPIFGDSFFNYENKNKESDERRPEDDVFLSSKVDEVQDEKWAIGMRRNDVLCEQKQEQRVWVLDTYFGDWENHMYR